MTDRITSSDPSGQDKSLLKRRPSNYTPMLPLRIVERGSPTQFSGVGGNSYGGRAPTLLL
jgi:hypothetical protein